VSAGLNFSQMGEGPPLVLLHGLFGSGANLGGVARALADSHSVFSLDLPNHGRSPWLENATLERMAAQVTGWMDQQDLANARFLGHSLGGKVAMQLALSRPGRVSALVVADIAPVDYPPGHDSIFVALDAVAAAGCESRQAAAAIMREHLAEEDVIQFLLTSLRRDADGHYHWRFNLAGLHRDYTAARAAPRASAPYSGPVLFIKGGESSYITEAHREAILRLFPRAVLKILPGCGHWLHAERPDLFNSLVRRFLLAQAS
jgi:esterase